MEKDNGGWIDWLWEVEGCQVLLYVCLQCLRECDACRTLGCHEENRWTNIKAHMSLRAIADEFNRRLLQSKDDLPAKLPQLPSKDGLPNTNFPPKWSESPHTQQFALV